MGMTSIDKKELSEADIRTKYITPAIVNAGWSSFSQMREEYPITKGRIIARGKTCKREKPLKADYVLFYKLLPFKINCDKIRKLHF